MAGNTIAKLAVVVTTDTGPMAQGMAHAAQHTQKFESQTQRANERLLQFSRQFISAGGSLGRFGGVVGALGAAGGPVGMAAAGMVAATAAASGFLLKIANLHDAAQDLKIQSWRDYADAFEKLNGIKLENHIGELQKTSEKWAELKKLAQEYFVTPTGLSTGGIADAAKNFLLRHTPGPLFLAMSDTRRDDRERDEKTKEMLKKHEREMELGKKRNEKANEAIREQGRKLEESARRAASVMDSVKTPFEKFYEKMAELKTLRADGLLNDDFFGRAKRQAEEELKKATTKPEVKAQAVGAVERFTAAGFSAMQRSNESKKLEENTKRTAVAAEKTVKAVEELAKTRPPTVTLQVSNF